MRNSRRLGMRNGPGMSTSSSGNDGRNDENDARLEETMRKHRAMLREMKRKHRVSSKILRRVRKRDLYKHQIQQQAFHAFLSDNLTTCASESFYSGSMYSAIDQLSVGTPNRSLLIHETPSKKQGSVASFSPSFAASLSPSCSPSYASSYASTYSSGYPYAIEESSSIEKEHSWRQESEVQTDVEYNDEDFSRLFRRDRQKHKRKSRPKQKTTKGLASVREVVEIDEDGDAFYSSLEVEIEDEKEYVESFVDCIPIPEEPTPRATNIESRRSNLKDGVESADRISTQPLEEEQFEDTSCVPQVIESTEDEIKNQIGLSFSSSISYSNNSSVIDTFEDDKNQNLCTQKVSKGLDAENYAATILIENEEEQNDNPDNHFSRHHPLQNDLERDIFQNSNDQPSFIENIEEDESEYFVDASMSNQAIHRAEESAGNTFGASVILIEEENANDGFVDSLPEGQSSQQDADEHLFRDSVENISHIQKIGDQSINLIETHTTSHAVHNGSEIENDEIDGPAETFSDALPSHLCNEGGENSLKIQNASDDISRLSSSRITQNSIDAPNTENTTRQVDSLDPALLAEEERQKIDNILEGFLEEINTMEHEKPKELSGTISQSGDISQFSAGEDAQFEDARMLEVENHEELLTEPIGDLDQNPLSISMFLRQGEDPNFVARSKQIDVDAVDENDIEVPRPIKDGVKEIDDMLDDFLRSMAEIDDPVDDNDEDNDPNRTEDFIYPSPEKIHFHSPTSARRNYIDTGAHVSQQKGGNIVANSGQSYESVSKASDGEHFENKSSPEKRLDFQDEIHSIENEEKRKDHSESLQTSIHQVVQTQPGSTSHELSNHDSPVRMSLPSNDPKSAFSSPAKSVQKENDTPLLAGDRKSSFSSPSRIIPNDVPKEDGFQSIEVRQTEVFCDTMPKPNGSSFDEKPKAKKDFVLPLPSHADESRSRITSPELNQSLGDNPGIFISKAIGIDSTRPVDPVATALSQDSSGDDVFSPIILSNSTNDNYSRQTNPIETTPSQQLLEEETESAKMITEKKAMATDIVTRSVQIIATEASPQSALDYAPKNACTDSPLSARSKKSNEEIDRFEQVPVVESTKDDGVHVTSSNDDAMNGPRSLDQISVSTISDTSERVDTDADPTDSKIDLLGPSPCNLESENGSKKIPSKSPQGASVPKNHDDPEKSFISIATPPILKKESALTELLVTPPSSKPPRRPRSATPTKSASPKIPFSRTAERLSKGSPRSELRARALSERSPHRVETSRSPLFLERSEGRSSIGGDSTKGWYTSPSRSRRSFASRELNNSKSSISTPPTSAGKQYARSVPPSSGRSKSRNEATQSPARSEIAKSTMRMYASPSRSMKASMTSPLRGMYSLSNPPRSPALSLHSRMPKGARSTIRRMQKKMTNQADNDENTHTDMLSVDTVRICTHKFVYKIHPKIGPCDRCWALASEEDREIFSSRGSHLRIAKTRSGCQRSCAIFPAEGKDSAPVRLCRPCFFATHQQVDGSSRLQVYRGNHVKVRPFL